VVGDKERLQLVAVRRCVSRCVAMGAAGEEATVVTSLACSLMTAVVTAGASRHVASTVACALLRLSANLVLGKGSEAMHASNEDSASVAEEFGARMNLIVPVIAEKVKAGRAGREPSISGDVRALRNCAEHEGLGSGANHLPCDGRQAKRRQRGRRKRVDRTDSSGSGDSDARLSEMKSSQPQQPEVEESPVKATATASNDAESIAAPRKCLYFSIGGVSAVDAEDEIVMKVGLDELLPEATRQVTHREHVRTEPEEHIDACGNSSFEEAADLACDTTTNELPLLPTAARNQWQRLAGALLSSSRLSHLRGLAAAPASGRAMISRVLRRSESSSSLMSADGIASDTFPLSARPLEPGGWDVGGSEVGDNSCDDDEDPALTVFINALTEIFTDGCSFLTKKERAKGQLAAFARARRARGCSKAEASSEGMQLFREFMETYKEFLEVDREEIASGVQG
jgi:hypothetical protein